MSDNSQELSENQQKWAHILAKSWTDADFKKQLIADPKKVLKEQGITMPPGMNYKVHENSPTVTHLVLPLKPSDQVMQNYISHLASGTP